METTNVPGVVTIHRWLITQMVHTHAQTHTLTHSSQTDIHTYTQFTTTLPDAVICRRLVASALLP